ncbi:MAG: toprim domain-containing protein [Deltaproteobacteria bacterium]|nr:toprim domain-containing protein [Deltaproteobacteria bacterium]
MISQETIVAVRERTDIVALINENVSLKKRGRSWLGLCPFHKEKTPSFSVNQESGVFYCFGCGESGGAIDYVMKLEGLTFPEAVRALADRCGVQVDETGTREEQERGDRRRQETEELYAVSQLCATYFQQQLEDQGHPLAHLAREELERRGLQLGQSEQIDEALKAHRIGYAPYGWEGLATFLGKQDVRPSVAEKLGLVVRRSGGDGHYDAFRHRLMFAVLDKAGRVVAFSGRALEEPTTDELRRLRLQPMSRPRPGEEERRPPPKYINSAESPIYAKGEIVFGLHQARLAIRSRKQAVLVEGNFDVLALHARGFGVAVAPLGTAFTAAQARLIKRYAPEVVVLFDGDAAGKKAAREARKPAREAGLSVKVASLPGGTDPDDLARASGIEAIEGLITGARAMLEHLIDETIGTEAVWDGSQQQTLERIQEVVGYLAEEREPTLRQMAKTYADEVASKLVVGGRSPANLRALERLVERGLAQAVARDRPPQGKPTDPASDTPEAAGAPWADDFDMEPKGPGARSKPQPEQIQLSIVGALLDFPALLEEPEVEEALARLGGELVLLVAQVRQVWDEKKSLHAAQLLDFMPEAIHAFAAARLAAPRFAEIEAARTELLDNAEKLRRRTLTGDKAVKVQELARAQGQGDVEAEDELLRELERVARKKRRLS